MTPLEAMVRSVVPDFDVSKKTERYDLPKDHPLYGRKVLDVVPAGSPDIEVVDGELVALTVAAAVAEPIEEEGVVEDGLEEH